MHHWKIMLNPWLVRPGTAQPLSIYLERVWEVQIVIYYRRFFEWISYKFEGWRQDLFKNSLSPNKSKMPVSSLRYVDFIREYCKQLFYGKDANEDGFPVRVLHRYERNDGRENALYGSDFDPTSNFDLVELTGLSEYVFFVARQYHSQPRFHRSVQIVNYHDHHNVETNFYCHVLHDALNSCNNANHRELKEHQIIIHDEDKERLSPRNTSLLVSPSIALEDIVLKSFLAGRLDFDRQQGDSSLSLREKEKFKSQLLLWIEMITVALQEKGLSVDHLPMECLHNYERRRLLEASLAYEKSLLPDFYASAKGALKLKDTFDEMNFCSVDTDAILSDSSWDFLFSAASNFTVSKQRKAFVLISSPSTGQKLNSMTLVADKDSLKRDKYLLFPEHRTHMAPCMWSDAQRKVIATDRGEENPVYACNRHLLSEFHSLLSDAIDTDTNVVIEDEWLSLPSSEMGLMNVLGNDFDPVIVLYYSPFFEWILSSYYDWYLGIDEFALQSMGGKARLIDYIRLICSQLFAAETHQPTMMLADILDFPDYTYNVWKRYMEAPGYEDNVKIVKSRENQGLKSFYCDVLGAKISCKQESDRLAKPSDFSEQSKAVPKYVELAMSWGGSNGQPSKEYFDELGQKYKERIESSNLSEVEMPKECLCQAEASMLLKVSLEYESLLMPDEYFDLGEVEMRRQFAKLLEHDAFCSLDVDKMLESQRWQFLFGSFNAAAS